MTIKCVMLPFPQGVVGCNGLCIGMEYGYKVAINSSACDLHRRHAFGHEMAHIVLDHMNQHGRAIMMQENEANAMAWECYRKFKNHYNDLVSGETTFELSPNTGSI